jgi:uncharacterized protein YndB with AHSA1/START domain
VQIVRSVVVDCHVEDVFDYLADPRNDREWRRGRLTELTCVDCERPHRIAWRWEAEGDVVDMSFALEPVWTSTRVTVRQERGHPGATILRKRAAARDLGRRLEALRRRLERR